jgi:redox-sensitive bicupin YhaK (pirin superfamily)
MSTNPVKRIRPLGFPWETADPFLFCVYHLDAYPAGNEALGPAASLAGRSIGQDFEGKDGWRMYHGDTVPGFPRHPHRGFETVTLVRRGFIDHSDSLGATARFGHGDVQWLTAGGGIEHSEMFPLTQREAPNPLELFQIWLNLPAANKLSAPYFSMLWADSIPRVQAADEAGRVTEVALVAGELGGLEPPAPPPDSWASRADAEVALENGDREGELLLLQGRPIGEPVAQYGPFVMNTQQEIQQAFADYRRTQFGRWPFATNAPVHPRTQARFARHADGRVEEPEAAE